MYRFASQYGIFHPYRLVLYGIDFLGLKRGPLVCETSVINYPKCWFGLNQLLSLKDGNKMSKMCLHVTIMKDKLKSVRQMGRKIIVKFNNCTYNHYHVFMGKFRSCIYTKYALNKSNYISSAIIVQNGKSG